MRERWSGAIAPRWVRSVARCCNAMSSSSRMAWGVEQPGTGTELRRLSVLAGCAATCPAGCCARVVSWPVARAGRDGLAAGTVAARCSAALRVGAMLCRAAVCVQLFSSPVWLRAALCPHRSYHVFLGRFRSFRSIAASTDRSMRLAGIGSVASCLRSQSRAATSSAQWLMSAPPTPRSVSPSSREFAGFARGAGHSGLPVQRPQHAPPRVAALDHIGGSSALIRISRHHADTARDRSPCPPLSTYRVHPCIEQDAVKASSVYTPPCLSTSKRQLWRHCFLFATRSGPTKAIKRRRAAPKWRTMAQVMQCAELSTHVADLQHELSNSLSRL